MREIKFRGKRLDNGEWAYGNLLTNGKETVIANYIAMGIGVCGECGTPSDTFHEVDPATVGQYTGLKDKHGLEIYEGDVVVDRWANEYTPVFQNGIYMAYNPKHLMQSDPSTQFNIIWKDGCEVIGNIYENPELLEGTGG